MPGSPPSSTRDPLTSPPPSTRSSSEMPVRNRMSSLALMSPIWDTGAARFPPVPPREAGADRGAACSKVFHWPQEGHFPSHLMLSYPHSRQTKISLFFSTAAAPSVTRYL